MNDDERYSPSEFVAMTNRTLAMGFENILIEGEVASFKINQGKWVFFDLKDDETSVNCFMCLWDLRVPIEDGMKVVIRGLPKVTKWGKFSVTVNAIRPVGEGNLKKAYEKLKKKLAGEGLFDPRKKRALPENLEKLGVISSTQAAGYADFVKILNARWGGMKITVAHTQVQGMEAADQIIRALDYFNQRGEVEVIAILRGGGSADDLSVFNDEKLVRAIAASKIPVITGIGHEVDESLADLAADVRASTPSNAAEMLSKDKKAEISRVRTLAKSVEREVMTKIAVERNNNLEKIKKVSQGLTAKYIDPVIVATERKMLQISQGLMLKYIEPMMSSTKQKMQQVLQKIKNESVTKENNIKQKIKILEVLNPEKVLKQGYAILSGKVSPGEEIGITTFKHEIKAEVKEIHERKENIK